MFRKKSVSKAIYEECFISYVSKDYLKDKLPDSQNHPKGRNPYAHVASEIKNKFNCSYKDLPDDKYEEVIKYINFLKENPN